jgi:hypothetical protein
MENTKEIVEDIQRVWPVALRPSPTYEELREQLTAQINQLINEDFEKLVFLLYRIDVDEARMRALLATNENNNSAQLLADLVLERQLQKIKSRRDFNQRDSASSTEEKW